MKISTKVVMGILAAGAAAQHAEAGERPNIVVILVDDMGYSDIGCYGGEVETPNIDRLAANGLRYRQFYNNARSCPSRAVLMTGLYPHQAGMGWMAAAHMPYPAYQGYINRNCVTLGEVMRTAGYSTYMTGKWHLSSEMENNGRVMRNWPAQRGFDRFEGIVGGGTNYFKTEWFSNNSGVRKSVDDDFYFTYAVTESAAGFIENHDFNASPFFMYVAHYAPHWPLQVPAGAADKYVERYSAGWDRLREERFERQKAMGLFPADAVLTPRDPKVPAWDSLPENKKREFTMRMAIYAAQIEIMDEGVGRIVDKLREKGELDNTLIMFMSDNGACAEFISNGPRKAVDGTHDTYESYRINWANLSSTPYSGYKHMTHEGGIASPMIAHYPKGIDGSLVGGYEDEYGHFADIMATCVAVSGAEYPKTFNGNEIVPMQGVSLLPNFTGGRTGRGTTFWEHEGNLAMRDGKWKLVLGSPENKPFDDSNLELYDMASDPTEMNDLAAVYPERVKDMYARWTAWGEDAGVFPIDTRGYGERAQDSRRTRINGEFDYNFGWWTLVNKEHSGVSFSIDTTGVISGANSARADIAWSGEKEGNPLFKWTFFSPQESRHSVAGVSFKAKSSKKNTVTVRISTVRPGDGGLLKGETFSIGADIRDFQLNNIQLERHKQYQIVFLFGDAGKGSVWIDDVRLDVN